MSKAMKRNSKPRVVRRGSVAVKIYEAHNRSADTDYVQFVVAWRDADGRRRLRNFSDEAQARTEAELTATKLAVGGADVLTLTSSDRTQYLAARRIADGLGVPLVWAVEDYAAAKGLLPAGTHLLSVIEFFKSRDQGSRIEEGGGLVVGLPVLDASSMKAVLNLRRVFSGDALMMVSMEHDSPSALSEKSKQASRCPHPPFVDVIAPRYSIYAPNGYRCPACRLPLTPLKLQPAVSSKQGWAARAQTDRPFEPQLPNLCEIRRAAGLAGFG